jgi:hypothetical protein
MKKVLFVSLVLLFALASCKKDELANSSIPSGTISALVDNIPVSFNVSTMADTSYHAYSGHILLVEGWQGEVTNSDFISFSIIHPERIGVGSYSPPSFCYWHQSDSTMYNLAGNDSTAQITITSVTDSTIEGTFNAIVAKNSYNEQLFSGYTVTNGKFNVKFQGASF